MQIFESIFLAKLHFLIHNEIIYNNTLHTHTQKDII